MEKQQFKAESKRLLDLMINSIYTHQEIFLREIISNASDAMDKLAYLSLTDQNVGLSRSDFAIDITVDEKERLLTVSDNGIGMSREDMEENLGTIAKSGSLQFKKDMEQQEDIDIIGQFGVGFYSAFMVADAVTVISKKYGSDEAWMWQSSGADGYTITACEKEAAGTQVIMHLKADTEDENYSRFLQEHELRSLVRKYSDYIRYPIRMDVTKTRVKEETKDSDKPEYESYTENETLNSMVPLWQRAKKDVTEEEYNRFYQEKFFDYENPLATIHLSIEGNITYKALLYIPARAPYDFYTKEYKKGLQLYSSGVLIMENCEDLLPEHFRFVKGIVDSQDLSLNISREMLQHDRQLKLIASNLEKKIKSELKKLLENDREKYEKFFNAFGRNLKYGLVSEYGMHKELLQDLMLFWSSKEQKLVTLQEYVDGMGEGQEHIYYAAGESRQRLSQLPQMELLQDKGYDVLFFTEDVDEFIPQTLQKFAEKDFKNIASDDLGLTSDEEKKAMEEKNEAAKPTLDFIKETLGDRVKDVRLSATLKSHPVCLVPDEGMSFEMEKYFQKMNPEMGFKAGRILELNPEHAVFATLQIAVAQDPEKAKKYVEVLYDQSLLMAGLPIDNPTEYTDRICSLMQ
ncbi:MAG TPA: molecular chaperone HtpG [Candidatus Avoscillospira avistercoris]|uniref:Chaperone protein HtpG n=1 Tax=Candidatus Avoscillospira avistercoris TaxID=2840707 RepID=A0A9D1FB14_9FIRM|nr:molecular chaperone HtpG [Candidatus Avoscillospira avistercoris]